MNKIVEQINSEFNKCNDLIYKKIRIGFKIYHVYFLETLCASDRVNNYVLNGLAFNNNIDNINKNLPSPNFIKISNKDKINYYLFNGYTVIINKNNIYGVETKADLDRSINEPATEKNLYGPKDSMVENIQKNLGLIKRRIKSNHLKNEVKVIGRCSKNIVNVLYIDNIVNIVSNDTKGSYDAVDYFIKNNHRRIALIQGNDDFESSVYRKKGYIDALNDNNIKINEDYMMTGKYTLDSGYENMKKLLNLSKRPTAVFCANDDIAVGAIKAINESGLNVPEDISIIGFDNSNFCNYVTPTLSSVRKDSLMMSEIGGINLLNIIKNKPVKYQRSYIESTLVIRKSVKKL